MKGFNWLLATITFVLLTGNVLGQKPAEPKPGEPKRLEEALPKWVRADPKDDELRKLMKDRVREYSEYVDKLQGRLGAIPNEDFTVQLSELRSASKRLWESILELTDVPEEKISVLTMQLEQAKEYEKLLKARSEVGVFPVHLVAGARAFRLDAEVQLLKAKSAASGTANPTPAMAPWSIPEVVSEEKLGPLRRLRNRLHK